jgi:hypothetical protein
MGSSVLRRYPKEATLCGSPVPLAWARRSKSEQVVERLDDLLPLAGLLGERQGRLPLALERHGQADKRPAQIMREHAYGGDAAESIGDQPRSLRMGASVRWASSPCRSAAAVSFS